MQTVLKKVNYRLSNEHIKKVRDVSEELTRQYGVKVSLEDAVRKMIDSFSLPSRSPESPMPQSVSDASADD